MTQVGLLAARKTSVDNIQVAKYDVTVYETRYVFLYSHGMRYGLTLSTSISDLKNPLRGSLKVRKQQKNSEGMNFKERYVFDEFFKRRSYFPFMLAILSIYLGIPLVVPRRDAATE